MPTLTAEQILAVPLKTIVVEVPEWGGVVRLRDMTADDREAWENYVRGEKGTKEIIKHARASLVVRCLVDDAGVRLFADEQAASLSGKHAAVLDRLFDECRQLCGLGSDELEKAIKN